ncbi:cpsf a subunit region protein, partial [Cystoisospora suis]
RSVSSLNSDLHYLADADRNVWLLQRAWLFATPAAGGKGGAHTPGELREGRGGEEEEPQGSLHNNINTRDDNINININSSHGDSWSSANPSSSSSLLTPELYSTSSFSDQPSNAYPSFSTSSSSSFAHPEASSYGGRRRSQNEESSRNASASSSSFLQGSNAEDERLPSERGGLAVCSICHARAGDDASSCVCTDICVRMTGVSYMHVGVSINKIIPYPTHILPAANKTVLSPPRPPLYRDGGRSSSFLERKGAERFIDVSQDAYRQKEEEPSGRCHSSQARKEEDERMEENSPENEDDHTNSSSSSSSSSLSRRREQNGAFSSSSWGMREVNEEKKKKIHLDQQEAEEGRQEDLSHGDKTAISPYRRQDIPSSVSLKTPSACHLHRRAFHSSSSSSLSTSSTSQLVVGKDSRVWVSSEGAIGLLLRLKSEETFACLALLQDAITKCMRSIGDLSSVAYHSLKVGGSIVPSKGFIDGDIVEKFLDLPPRVQK